MIMEDQHIVSIKRRLDRAIRDGAPCERCDLGSGIERHDGFKRPGELVKD